MTTSAKRLESVVGTVPAIVSALVLTCGVVVLLGWQLDVPLMRSMLNNAPTPMNPATAICFALGAASLYLRRNQHAAQIAVARTFASVIALVGALRLAGYALGGQARVDEILYRSKLAGNVMAPNTAIALVLIALALFFLDFRTRRRGAHPATFLTLACASIALLSIIGYLFRVGMLYGVRGYNPMALNTAVCFALLCIGILCARPQREPIATLLDDTVGGAITRRLLPAAFGLPIVLAYLRLLGERRGWFTAEFGLTLFVLGLIVILNVLVWSLAQVQRRVDLRRRLAEHELRRVHEAEQQAHAALKQAQSALVQTEKLAGLGQMVAGVAHEINNPLAFVSNNVAVLQRDLRAMTDLLALYSQGDAALKEKLPELSQQIREQCERMDLAYMTQNLGEIMARSRDGLKRIQQIVKDLREFARLDAGDLQEADLNAGIESTVNIIRGLAKKKQVALDVALEPLPPVKCFPAKINQVVMNLLSNAIDACSENGNVTIKTSRVGGAVRIEVLDTGKGIAPAIREKIFDPFFTTKTIGQGTGLGLSISYGIIKEHGGTIDVESTVGRGSRFTVTLPLTPSPSGVPT